jgi:hypothetical protein
MIEHRVCTPRIVVFLCALSFAAGCCRADDDGPSEPAHPAPAPSTASSSATASSGVQTAAGISKVAAPDDKTASDGKTTSDGNGTTQPNSTGGAEAAHYSTEAKWALAGYNNDEVIYTIIVTNQDARILRCVTELKGYYFDEKGQKQSISDRQSSTVFPEQQAQVGNWMGMDEKSGATYSVRCHPV